MKKYLVVFAAMAIVFASCDPKKVDYTRLSLKQTELSMSPGESQRLNVLWEPAEIETAPDCAWASSNPDVATVSNGTVTAVAAGEATITATYGELKAACSVTVANGPLDLIKWGGFSLWNLDRDNILSNDTLKTRISYQGGTDVSCVLVSASYAIWDDDIAMDPNTGEMSGLGYFVELPGTVWLITDALDNNGPNYYYLGSDFIEVKDYDSFNWNDTANAYCCVTGKLGDAAKHLEWYNDESATLDDVTEIKGGVINAVNWNTQMYAGAFFGLAGEGIFVEDEDGSVLCRANFSWFMEDDVLYGLKGILSDFDEEGNPQQWDPKEPAEWGILTPKHYEQLPESSEEEVSKKYVVKEFKAPKQDYRKFTRTNNVFSKK